MRIMNRREREQFRLDTRAARIARQRADEGPAE